MVVLPFEALMEFFSVTSMYHSLQEGPQPGAGGIIAPGAPHQIASGQRANRSISHKRKFNGHRWRRALDPLREAPRYSLSSAFQLKLSQTHGGMRFQHPLNGLDERGVPASAGP